jgi:hypothetical protein
MINDVILNEVSLITSIVSTVLLITSEVMGTYGTKHKSLTSLFLSMINLSGCLDPVIQRIDGNATDKKLIKQVEEEIRLEELREVLVRNRTTSQPTAATLPFTSNSANSGQILDTISLTTSIHPSLTDSSITTSHSNTLHTLPAMSVHLSPPHISFVTLRSSTMRSYSDPPPRSSSVSSFTLNLPLQQSLEPLQSGALGNVGDSNMSPNHQACSPHPEPLQEDHLDE